jgi:hypothetical protein
MPLYYLNAFIYKPTQKFLQFQKDNDGKIKEIFSNFGREIEINK